MLGNKCDHCEGQRHQCIIWWCVTFQEPDKRNVHRRVIDCFVHSWTKVYRLFSASCKTHRKWTFLEFLDLGTRPDSFSLNLWNIIYLGPVVMVLCTKIMSNFSNYRCQPRLILITLILHYVTHEYNLYDPTQVQSTSSNYILIFEWMTSCLRQTRCHGSRDDAGHSI